MLQKLITLKSSFASEPKKGQLYIVFGAKPSKSVTASDGVNSKYSKAFIDLVKTKGSLKLPFDVLIFVGVVGE